MIIGFCFGVNYLLWLRWVSGIMGESLIKLYWWKIFFLIRENDGFFGLKFLFEIILVKCFKIIYIYMILICYWFVKGFNYFVLVLKGKLED